MVLPFATGTDRYNGHRIYGALSFIANGDYFIFLDEDNALEPNHIDAAARTALILFRKEQWAEAWDAFDIRF